MLVPRFENGSGVHVEDLDGACVVAGDHDSAVAPDLGAVGDIVESGDCLY